MLSYRMKTDFTITTNILPSPTLSVLFFFCVQTQKINTGVTMLNWLQMKVIFSHSPPLCLGNSVQRQSQAEMGTLNSPLGCYFGNPCIHIYCQYEGMHRNKDFIRTQYTHQHQARKQQGEKVMSRNIQFVKVLLATREIEGHESRSELSGTKKKTFPLLQL